MFQRILGLGLLSLCVFPSFLQAQVDGITTNIRVFGHQEFAIDQTDDRRTTAFSIGEHSLFLVSRVGHRLTFLGEHATRFDAKSATHYSSSIERAQVRYDMTARHAFMFGKMHTPVNYWNDVYHHGRLFFPTIDRPLMFSQIVPLHTLGLRFQGQNLTDWRIGYDLMIGNGIASTDISDTQSGKSLTAAAHVKPIDEARIGLSYYLDHLDRNQPGAHSGHVSAVTAVGPNRYTGPLDFEMASLSAAYFGPDFQVLFEGARNRTTTDSLGTAINWAGFLYGGWEFQPGWVAYAYYDRIHIAPNDLRIQPADHAIHAAGLRREIGYMAALKVEVRRWNGEATHATHGHHTRTEFRIQFSYGF